VVRIGNLSKTIISETVENAATFPLEIIYNPSQSTYMTKGTKRIYDLLSNVWIAFLGSIASIAGLIWFAIEKVQITTVLWLVVLLSAFALLFAIAIYSIRVRLENIQFRNFVKTLHRINHDYRDMLSAAFKHPPQALGTDGYINFLKQSESKTIKSVCQKISKVFSTFTRRECTVTVKLIVRDGGKVYCETYERSEENCLRDTGQPRLFEVDAGSNTAFDKALMYINGRISYFQSSDLTKEPDYRNQRDHWSDFYKCVIVVPIRSIDQSRIGYKDCSDNIGFLCVDTLSPNRLNDGWHVELLAGFADQMYNFMSLMRGKYQLNPLANGQSGAETRPAEPS